MINAGTLFYRLYYIFRSAAKVSQGTTYGFVSSVQNGAQVTSSTVPTCNEANQFKCDEGYECCIAGADYCESDANTVGSQVRTFGEPCI